MSNSTGRVTTMSPFSSAAETRMPRTSAITKGLRTNRPPIRTANRVPVAMPLPVALFKMRTSGISTGFPTIVFSAKAVEAMSRRASGRTG